MAQLVIAITKPDAETIMAGLLTLALLAKSRNDEGREYADLAEQLRLLIQRLE
jgi:hypothetical protein